MTDHISFDADDPNELGACLVRAEEIGREGVLDEVRAGSIHTESVNGPPCVSPAALGTYRRLRVT